MNVFGITAMIVSGLAAVVIGLASPAQADLGHNQWVNQMSSSSSAMAPHVDTNAHR